MIFLKNIVMLWVMLSFSVSFAQPNLETKQVLDSIIIFQDFKDPSLYHYVPQGLKLVVDNYGKPNFKFIQMRYTGTRATADQGDHKFKSLLRFKVAQHIPKKTKIDNIKNSLIKKGVPILVLKKIALSNLKAELVHAADAVLDSSKTISDGFFEKASTSIKNKNWNERDFTIRLNTHDSQIFWEGFMSHKPTISVNYSFYAKAYSRDNSVITGHGSDVLKKAINTSFKEKDTTSIQLKEVIINAGAIPIVINTERWPDLVKKIDINEQIPPDYGALDIYCFDFNNELRDDLYAKRIEIKAVGVGGKEVKAKKVFKYNTPELYAQTTQFINAIKLSEPYQYRITEIFHDGNYTKTNWKVGTSWNSILDITTKPEH